MARTYVRLLTVLATLLALVGVNLPSASGQDGRGGALMARVQEELDQLKLTDEQKAKTQEILSKAREQIRGMADELIQAEPAVRRQKLNAFLTDVVEQIKPVLNEQQRSEFEQRIQRMRLQARPGGNQPGPNQPGGNQPGANQTGTNPPDGAPQPDNRPGPGARNGPGATLERLRNAVQELELSDEQRGLIGQIFADTQAKFREIRAQGQGDMPAMREKLTPLLEEMRDKLMKILDEKQKTKLQELMNQSGGPGRGPDGAGPGGRPPMMRPEMRDEPEVTPTTAPIAEAPEIPASAAVGQPAPDFNLKKLDGQLIQLSSYKGKIVLLVFGSYTSPSFRQRATALERMRREYSTRINPIIVYTSENHPVGRWEVQRNKDEGISIEQPKEMDARLAAARRARDGLKLTTPIVVDSMDDATSSAYGGTTNAAILIGRDGTILARQRWFEPYALRAEIDAALK